MSITKISRSLLDTGIADSSDATAISITSDEKVGIGTSSPDTILDIESSQPNIRLTDSDNNHYARIGGSAGDLILEADGGDGQSTSKMTFMIDGNDKLKLDANGSLELGHGGAAFQRADSQAFSIITPASGGGQGIALKRLDTNTDQGLGEITWSNNTQDGLGKVKGKTDGAANNLAITFETASSGTVAERARVRSHGDFLIGTTVATQNSGAGLKLNNDGGQGRCFVVGSGSGGEGFSLHDGSAYKFFVTYAGVINATTTTISGISDERLKENIKDLDQGLADILKLKPRTFDWKEGEGTGEKNVSGFIAQEAETAGFEEFVGDWKHDTLSDAKSFGQAGLIPALVKAIQEQQTIIEDLKARIETLEG